MDESRVRELKRVYCQITKGFTPVTYNGGKFFIKHFGISDQSEIDDFYYDQIKILEGRGIPSEKMVLERLNSKKVWMAGDEIEIAAKEGYILQLEKSRDKQFVPSQIESFNKMILTERIALAKKKKERAELIGRTRESFANEATNTFFIIKSFKKDEECKIPFFTDEEFSYMDDDKLYEYNLLYNASMKLYKADHIKRIALQSFFQNLFYLAENIHQFWGVPIKDLSIYQSDLSSYGRYYKGIIQNSEHEIPEDVRTDPDKLVSYTKMNEKMKEQMNKGTGHNVTFNGNAEDMKKMNIKVSNPYGVEARRLGRNLTKEDMLMIDKGLGHQLK